MDAAQMVYHSWWHQQTGHREAQCPKCFSPLTLACCPTHGYLSWMQWREGWIGEPCPFTRLHESPGS